MTDSNGKGLDVRQLYPEATVIKKDRYTVEEATNCVPKLDDPSAVAEIVFQIGLNDFRVKGHNAEKIQDNTLKMQFIYKHQFPNARQHVTALPPLANSHIHINKHLQQLCSFTQCNFISTKVFRDKASGKLRSGLMKDHIHYNEWGTRVLAKEIKKSLYSSANLGNTQLKEMAEMLNPAISAPAVSAPASISAPAISAPAISAPAISAPAISAPAIRAPAISAPAISAPAISAPAISAPVNNATANCAFINNIHAKNAPVYAAPVHEYSDSLLSSLH